MNNIKRNKAERKYYAIQKGALMRGISFEITYREYLKYFEKACAYCGIKAIGIDRIDSIIGYRKDNIVTCCGICNMMKATLEREAFIIHCKRITLHTDTKTIEEDNDIINIENYKHSKNQFQLHYISSLIKASNGNVLKASKISKMHRADIYKLMKKFNIKGRFQNETIATK